MATATARFHTPTRLLFGDGLLASLPAELAALDLRRPVLVSDRGLAAAGQVERVRHLIGAVAVIDTVEANPSIATVDVGAQQLRASACDAVVALGGGSVIDAAKAMAVMTAHEGSIVDYEIGRKAITRRGLPLITVPTTAGTGSEVTWWSVITDPARGAKFDVGAPLMAAVLALDDPELTHGLPPALTAATGLDALTHAIEALSTRGHHPITDALALEAIRLLGEHLPQAYADGRNAEARRGTMLGAVTAGLAFPNAGLGAVHGLTAPIGGRLGAPHGQANAALLPAVMRFNLEAAAPAYARIDAAWGGGGEARQAVARIEDLVRRLGIPSLRELGVTPALVPELAAAALGPWSNCNANPRPVDQAAAEAILHDALQGGGR